MRVEETISNSLRVGNCFLNLTSICSWPAKKKPHSDENSIFIGLKYELLPVIAWNYQFPQRDPAHASPKHVKCLSNEFCCPMKSASWKTPKQLYLALECPAVDPTMIKSQTLARNEWIVLHADHTWNEAMQFKLSIVWNEQHSVSVNATYFDHRM